MSSRNPSGLHLLPRFRAGVAVVAVAVTGVTGCSSSSPHKASAPSTPPTTAATTASAPAVNPLTGVGAPPSGPVIAVKVDDTENGRPSRGIDQADVIYLEQAEGGLSRMLAVFSGHRPRVEAVRSVRTSDPELLAQYGRAVLVFSGGARPVLPIIDRALLHTVVNDRGGPGFSRDRSRPAPYNLVSDLAVVAKRVKGDGVRDVGFRFASSDPRLASAPAAAQVRTSVGATTVTFVWDAARHRYVRTIGGRKLTTAAGVVLGKPNVLVQFCSIVPDRRDIDVNGNPSQYTHTVGSGRVVLFRDGKRIEGRWSRPSAGAPTTFTDGAGKPLTFAPGGLWVALVATTAKV